MTVTTLLRSASTTCDVGFANLLVDQCLEHERFRDFDPALYRRVQRPSTLVSRDDTWMSGSKYDPPWIVVIRYVNSLLDSNVDTFGRLAL